MVSTPPIAADTISSTAFFESSMRRHTALQSSSLELLLLDASISIRPHRCCPPPLTYLVKPNQVCNILQIILIDHLGAVLLAPLLQNLLPNTRKLAPISLKVHANAVLLRAAGCKNRLGIAMGSLCVV